MKKTILFVCALCILALNACQMMDRDDPLLSRNDEAPVIRYSDMGAIDGQYLVLFKEGAVDTEEMKQAEGYENRVNTMRTASVDLMQENGIPAHAIKKVFPGVAQSAIAVQLNPAQLASMQADDRVAEIEQDRIITLGVSPQIKVKPPLNPTGGSGSPGGQHLPYGVNRVGGNTGAALASQTAWIIDTGIDLDHTDLNVDASRSTTFCTQGTYTMDGNDGHGHGTHIAGTIGAMDNGFGVVGVAPGVDLVSIKVLSDEGYGELSDVINGLLYVGYNAAPGDVVNLSFGGPYSSTLDLFVQYCQFLSGATLAVAAGNDSMDAAYFSPSGVDFLNVFTIGSIDEADMYSNFSNFGQAVDFAAPGSDIYSTWKDNQYATLSGTSMAAPHAAGILLYATGEINSSGTSIGDPDGGHPIIHK